MSKRATKPEPAAEKPVSRRVAREQLFAGLTDELVQATQDERHKQGVARDRVVSTVVIRDRLFAEQFEDAAKRVFGGRAIPRGYALKKPSSRPSPRVLNLLLSDLHFGANLDPGECPKAYGAHEEARRLAHVVLQTAEFKLDHRKDTELHVHLCGDIMQGQLHDPRDGTPQANQVAAAVQYLGQAVEFLAQHFPKVVVDCTPGNHGRNMARHRERGVNQKVDAIETHIYVGVRAYCHRLANVSVRICKTPYYTQDLFGAKAFFTHGDTVLKPGYPGKSINTADLKAQTDAINGNLEAADRYRLFVVGHVHIGSITHLPGGVTFITNGCIVPPDAYALSIGITDCTCGQWLWESVPGHIVGDHRFITIDDGVDANADLESIITPYIPTDEL